MPDLAEGRQRLRPTSAVLLPSRCVGYSTMKAVGPWPTDSPAYRIVDRHVSGMSLVAAGASPPRYEANALTKRMRFEDCDGRDRAGLLLIATEMVDPEDWRSGYSHRPVVAAVIARSIQENGPAVRYHLDFAEADHLGRTIDYAHMLAFEWWMHVIATADIERILRREQELGIELSISAEVTFSADRSIAGALAEMRHEADRCLVGETRSRIARQASEGFREANARLR